MSLTFEELGTGKTPLVCIHGWGCNSGQFHDVARLLAPSFRIFLPDLPGHGRTPLGSFVPTFENYANALVDFIESLGPNPPVLLGHSMGGVLALIAASKTEVAAIVNLDGAFPAKPGVVDAQRVFRERLKAPGDLSWFRDSLREAFFDPSELGERAEEIIAGMCSMPEPVLHFLPDQIGTLDAASVLPRLNAHALYVGSARPRFDEPVARMLNPKFSFCEIPGTGHFLQIFAPDAVAELVRKFAT